MLEIRNDEGDTSLEALHTRLDETRTRQQKGIMGTQSMSDIFEGHNGAAVLRLARLKRLTEPTNVELSRLSSGCTCEQCTAGFLSPRMSLALLCQAETQSDMLSHDIETMSGSYWVQDDEDNLEYVAERVRDNLKTNKSMRQGFANLCKHIATCIKAKILPTESNVSSAFHNANEWPPATRSFLRRGGTISSVASMLIRMAMC